MLIFSITACGSAKTDIRMDSTQINPSTSFGVMDAPAAGGVMEEKQIASYDGGAYLSDETAPLAEYDVQGETAPPSGAMTDSVSGSNSKKIITTHNINLETTEYEKFVSDIQKYISEKQGYVEFLDSWGQKPEIPYVYSRDYYASSNYGRTSNLTARVPSNEVDAFLELLKSDGHETSYSISQTDVSLDYYDIGARITALETQRNRVLQLIEQAKDVSELILLEQRLTDINYELDSKQSQIKHYDNQIEYTTVYVYVQEVLKLSDAEKFNPSLGDRISTGFKNTFYNIKTGIVDIFVWLVVNSIIIVPIVIIALVCLKLIKRKKLSANKTTSTQTDN